MENASMTARVCAFARAYHHAEHRVRVFDDPVARALLGEEEYAQVANHMAAGIRFFAPDFEGDEAEALRLIVDQKLSPAPLARAAFAEDKLAAAVAAGTGQYLILAAGYDTFAYRRPLWASPLRIIELDHPATAADKREHLQRAGLSAPADLYSVAADLSDADWLQALLNCGGFDRSRRSFCSLLGLTYYLPQAALERLLATLSELLPPGSAIVFDYPDSGYYGEGTNQQAQLAAAAGEQMQACYSAEEMASLLQGRGFCVAEDLSPEVMTARYFAVHNAAEPAHPLTAPAHVRHCLALRA